MELEDFTLAAPYQYPETDFCENALRAKKKVSKMMAFFIVAKKSKNHASVLNVKGPNLFP